MLSTYSNNSLINFALGMSSNLFRLTAGRALPADLPSGMNPSAVPISAANVLLKATFEMARPAGASDRRGM
jgi:hypothetical protein